MTESLDNICDWSSPSSLEQHAQDLVAQAMTEEASLTVTMLRLTVAAFYYKLGAEVIEDSLKCHPGTPAERARLDRFRINSNNIHTLQELLAAEHFSPRRG